MAENKNFVIGITQGDINGISYEVIIKSLSDNRIMEICTPVVYGLSKVVSYHKKYMEMSDFAFQYAKTAEQLSTKRPNLINLYDEEVKLELGTSTKIAGQMSERSLYAAGRDLKNNLIDAIVTAPMNKNNIQSDKFTFSGHSEFFNHYFGGKDNPCLMMLVSENLRMGFVTNHIPVKSVAENITTEKILQKIETLNLSLKKDFALNNPTIAVLALNPHNGDDGLLGYVDYYDFDVYSKTNYLAIIGKVRASSPLITSKRSGFILMISSTCSSEPLASLMATMFWQSLASRTVVSARRLIPVRPGTL